MSSLAALLLWWSWAFLSRGFVPPSTLIAEWICWGRESPEKSALMTLKKVEMRLGAQADIVAVRQAARSLAVEIGLTIIDQTKVVTAASELARNTLVHGGRGTATLEILREAPKQGLPLTSRSSAMCFKI